MQEVQSLCKCGCKQPLPYRPNGRKSQFIRGHKNSYKKVETKCANCDKSITVENWRIIRSQNVFCNKQCKYQYESEIAKKSVTCFSCEKEFEVMRCHRQGKRIFCSLKCFFDALRAAPDKKVSISCSNCDKPIRVFPSRLKINKEHFYCNRECRASHIIGSNNPSFTSGKGRKAEYGFNWKSQRRKALERDNHTCQHCGKIPKKSRYLHVHHVIPAYTFNGDYEAANQLGNLLTLCLKCHKDAEFGRIAIQAKLL